MGGQGAMAECDQYTTYACIKSPCVTQEFHVQGTSTMRILGNT